MSSESTNELASLVDRISPTLDEDERALMQLILKRLDKKTELGDSGLTTLTLPSALTQKGKDEVLADNTTLELDGLSKLVEKTMVEHFGKLEPLGPNNGHKWCEAFGEFFQKFLHSQSILTTSNYETANFEKCKLDWRQFKFHGQYGISQATVIMDTGVITYLKSREIINIFKGQPVKTRDVWIRANKLSKASRTSIFQNYFEDAINFWSYVTQDTLSDAFMEYLIQMNNKYDKVFVKFMESLGFPMYAAYIWMGNTAMGKTLLKTLETLLAQYRKNYSPIEGITKFLDKVEDIEVWTEGVNDNCDAAAEEIRNRRKRQGDSTVYLLNTKRAQLKDFGYAPLSAANLTPVSDKRNPNTHK